jgi:hypothetical protein
LDVPSLVDRPDHLRRSKLLELDTEGPVDVVVEVLH